MQWYKYTKTQLASELETNLEKGLTQDEAARRLREFGPNMLPEKPQDSWAVLLARQFQSPLIYILVICAVAVFLLGEHIDAVIIAVVLIVNAVIGTIQEGKSGKVLQSLKKLSQTECTVLRNGIDTIIPEPEVVKGDILVLQEGQRVAADARIIFGYNLGIDESALTGESGVILKKDHVFSEDKIAVASQHNMLFKSTSVLTGNGRAIVVGTGINTEIGKISKALLEPHTEIPLQRNIRLLSKIIIYAICIISVALFALGISTGREPREMFALVVSLAVSIVPEGLPLVLTVILAHGVWRMSKHNALVKKLQAVEALGQANVIAVDKTGTITENQMIITSLHLGGRDYEVTGNGYDANGSVLLGGSVVHENFDIELSALIGSLASDATLQLDEATGQYKVSGDPTEAAMTVFGEKLGLTKESLLVHYKVVAEIPFDYKNKFKAIFWEHKSRIFCSITGAPEVIFRHASHIQEGGQSRVKTPQDHKRMEEALERFSSQGFRVVAFGYKRLAKNHVLDNINDLVFVGLFAIRDAIRPQAKEAIAKAAAAGVKIVMITGDHKITAQAIAREAGIYHEGDEIITGSELETLSPSDLAGRLIKVSIFARVTPEDKMKIIKAYEHAGLIVAMTGDGVNDAPSLVAADLGVAMGKIGTEVAKEAADIILLDDNLLSIVAAIEEGRVMYQNIKKALQFLFSTSLGELFTIVTSLILGLPLPVTAVQILWLNLVTDPLLGAALALERGEKDLAAEGKKFVHNKYFIDTGMIIHMLVVGVLMTCGALYAYQAYSPLGEIKGMTMALTVLAAFQWFNALNCRFLAGSFLVTGIFGCHYWSIYCSKSLLCIRRS